MARIEYLHYLTFRCPNGHDFRYAFYTLERDATIARSLKHRLLRCDQCGWSGELPGSEIAAIIQDETGIQRS